MMGLKMDKKLEKIFRKILREHQNDLDPPEHVKNIIKLFKLEGIETTEKTTPNTDIMEALKPEKRKKLKIVNRYRYTVKRHG